MEQGTWSPSTCSGSPCPPGAHGERREQKMVPTADLSPGKQSNNEQVLVRMKPSYVTCLASTITGFSLKTKIHVFEVPSLFLRWGFPTDRVFLHPGAGHTWKLWTCVGVSERGTSELKLFNPCHVLKSKVQWLTPKGPSFQHKEKLRQYWNEHCFYVIFTHHISKPNCLKWGGDMYF